MFDIGWTELLVIAVVLIVVVGPKDLPPMLRAFGKMTANFRKMAGEFRTQFDEALRESEMDDVRKTISDAQRLNPTSALRDAINPLRQMGQEIRSDLENATRVPSQPASTTPQVLSEDVEAQHAVEGAESTSEAVAAPADPAPTAATSQPAPITSGQTGPVAPVQAAPAPSAPAPTPVAETKLAASPPAANVAPAASTAVDSPAAAGKAKPVRKAAAGTKITAGSTESYAVQDPASAKAKRARTPAGEAEPGTPKATRRRASKTTDTAKDDA